MGSRTPPPLQPTLLHSLTQQHKAYGLVPHTTLEFYQWAKFRTNMIRFGFFEFLPLDGVQFLRISTVDFCSNTGCNTPSIAPEAAGTVTVGLNFNPKFNPVAETGYASDWILSESKGDVVDTRQIMMTLSSTICTALVHLNSVTEMPYSPPDSGRTHTILQLFTRLDWDIEMLPLTAQH